MLDVIGAGATAVSDRDWHEVWRNSKESKALEEEIEQIHSEGRKHPPVAPTVQTRFATPWIYQTRELFKRQHLAYWRDPTYLMSKLTLNIIGGLFIGFTFFKAKNTIQGTQNKLFVRLIRSASTFVLMTSFFLAFPGDLHVDHPGACLQFTS